MLVHATVDVVACVPMNLLHSYVLLRNVCCVNCVMKLLHSYVLLRNVCCVNCVMKLVDVIEPSHRHV